MNWGGFMKHCRVCGRKWLSVSSRIFYLFIVSRKECLCYIYATANLSTNMLQDICSLVPASHLGDALFFFLTLCGSEIISLLVLESSILNMLQHLGLLWFQKQHPQLVQIEAIMWIAIQLYSHSWSSEVGDISRPDICQNCHFTLKSLNKDKIIYHEISKIIFCTNYINRPIPHKQGNLIYWPRCTTNGYSALCPL